MAKANVYNGNISDIAKTTFSFSCVGISEPEVKTKITKLNTSMKYREHEHDTEISKKFWEMKDQERTSVIKWKTLMFAIPYQNERINCDLCLSKKLNINWQATKNFQITK